MATLGHAILIIGLAVALYGIGASLYGVRSGDREWVVSGRRAMYALAALMLIAFALLEDVFLRNDFSFRVVATSSSSTIPVFYKLAAPWSSQQGSLLLWVTLLSLWSSIVLFSTRRRMREIAPYATAVLLGLGAFFLALAAFAANPFTTIAPRFVPAQGNGLDPLLMHPSMIIHPPMLYTGYTLMAIPFAFAIGALVSGQLGSEWIRDTRRFALLAWMALGTGIILGARWSYTELGWGGYWGWDAVENAALMPWLVMTAFIHSIQIQEKRGMLKVWNVSLVLLAGILTIFGTFLVRSGVLDSIHAFGASTLGIPFIALLCVLAASSIGLVLWRSGRLQSEHTLDSMVSREAIFLLQNLVLCAMVFVIFWITVFPLISEVLTGTKVSVGPPAFTPFVVPLALVLVALTGIGPMISWRRASIENLRRNFFWPITAGLLTIVLVGVLTGAASRPLALLMFGLGAFVIAGIVQEVYRGTSVRRALTRDLWPVAMIGLVRRNRRRYGGYLAHVGIAVLLIGIAASSSFQHSVNPTLSPGQSATVGGYTYHYLRPTVATSAEKISFGAVIAVTHGGRRVALLHSERGYYPSNSLGDGVIGRFFDSGNADSTIGLDAGVRLNLWSVVQAGPNQTMSNEISKGNSLFAGLLQRIVAKTAGESPAAQNAAIAQSGFWNLRDRVVTGIAEQYVSHPFPVPFLFIVAPLVNWIWVGALIVLIGGLIAVWPAPLAVRRRELAVYRARLARELA